MKSVDIDNGAAFVDEVLGCELVGAITSDLDEVIDLTFEAPDGTWRSFTIFSITDDAGSPLLTFAEDFD